MNAPRQRARGRARLVLLASGFAGVAAAGCASPGIPPGGPPDKLPPAIVRVTPESGAVNVRASSIVIRLDEVVAERPGGRTGGTATAAGLGGIVLLSPGDGREKVQWRRDAIEIEPRGGFRANTSYRVTLLPGLADLRGNVLEEPREIVFSTGAAIPEGELSGVVFDWVEGRVAPRASIEMFLPRDTTFRWRARADSAGRYTVRDLAPGDYHFRAWLDANGDRRIDEREAFDSATVTISGRVERESYAFAHDTVGPRIENVEPLDSTGLRVQFDRAVALGWVPGPASVLLQREDSSAVPLGEMMTAARWDSLAAVARAAADSAARAADTTARAADTTAARAQQARPPRPGDAAADSAAARWPKLSRAVPARRWVIALPASLPPGTYRLKAVGVEGLAGARRTSEREFRIREPAPRDTTTPPRQP